MKKIIPLLLVVVLTSFTMVGNSISYRLLFNVNKNIVSGKNKTQIDSLIIECLNKTKKDLTFDLNSKTKDLYKTKKAHCVGYTMYFNRLLINELKTNNIGNVIIYQSRVKVLVYGQDIHFTNSPSLKDHDISIIQDNNNKIKYYVDPSLSEVFGNIIIKE